MRLHLTGLRRILSHRAPTSLEIAAALNRTAVAFPLAPLTTPLAIDAWATAAELATAFGRLHPLSDTEGFGVIINGTRGARSLTANRGSACARTRVSELSLRSVDVVQQA